MEDRVNDNRANLNGESRELDELLHAFCDDRLDETGRDRLLAMLSASDDACRRYVEFVHLCIGMSYPSATPGDLPHDVEPIDGAGNVAKQTDHSIPTSLAIPPLGEDLSPLNTGVPSDLTAGFSRFLPRLGLGATFGLMTVCLIVIAWGIWTVANRPDAENGSPPEVPMLAGGDRSQASPDDSQSAAFVARIVKASTDCRWGKLTTPVEFLVRVRAGDRLHIAAGLVELEFYSGARVILHGPAVFTPTGIASGHLESGRLTGEVADGNFRLMTPAAEVIDLGTSFGVAADAAVGTDVVVFDGRVQVVSLAEGGRAGEALDMTRGMAARFRIDGSTEYGLHTDAGQFQRGVSSNPRSGRKDELCLIDVIAGGDGLGAALAGAIDPLTGQRDYGDRVRREPKGGRGKFNAISWNPLIDSLFIPSRKGTKTQVDSEGHRADLPANTGRTWGPIWARSKVNLAEMDGSDFWEDSVLARRQDSGLRELVEGLKRSRNGLVGVHANVGVTFNLQAVRLLHSLSAAEFRGEVVNIENSRDIPPGKHADRPRLASFHVFVDGELRFQRLDFGVDDGKKSFAIPLQPEDHFLTIITTDSGKSDYYDHVVLVDPVIALAGKTDQGDREEQ